MIEFSEIIGHEDIIQHFKRSIEMGKVSQGYIINGEEGSGKKTLTRAIIKIWSVKKAERSHAASANHASRWIRIISRMLHGSHMTNQM
jgi:DNA polymerase III gamma/tau subunit